MDQTARDMKDLILRLNRYTEEYDKGNPIISDKEWDNLYFILQTMEQETGIIYPDSPTQSISYTVKNELKKVEHNHPMLSLAKTKDVAELHSFVKGHDWCMMYKLDGLTCSLTYEDGNLVSAETRGDGYIGEDILHNILVMKSVPKTIPEKGTVIVDGEVICTIPNFEQFKDEYKNPRNFASGSIRLLDSKESASRSLTFVAWDLIKGCPDIDFFFRRLEKLDDWGFETVPRVGDAETIDDAITILDEERKYENIYPIDGYVIRFESQKYYESCGKTDHHFSGAIAYKFYDEEYETELNDIIWSVGRTGVLTPVAIFDPIEIDGTEISRASLHNLSVLIDTLGKEPELGQKIWVYKANMIIPQISRAEKNDFPHDHCLGQHPLICPFCGKVLDVVESDSGVLNVVCPNKTCNGKLLYRVEHYCSKKGLDIKGLSEKTIEKLIDWGWINDSITELYDLQSHRRDWISKPGFGAASVDKILNAIENSKKNVDLTSFISAIGIPLVGNVVAKTIAKEFDSWQDFRDFVDTDDAYFWDFEGIGEEIDASLKNFDYAEADELAAILNFKQQDSQSENPTPAAAINGKTFVITGRLSRKRDDIKADIEALGGKVTGSVSSKTDYLICNDKNSTTGKSADAKRLGIPIITEEEYLEMKS